MSQSEILAAVASGTLTIEQAAVLLGNTSKPAQSVKFKVSEKGACSVYGLGRFPVTLYSGQWQRLLAAREQLEAFLADHASELAVKE